MNLIDIIYDFFYQYIWSSHELSTVPIFNFLEGTNITLFGWEMTLNEYLCSLSTFVVMALLLIAVGLGVVWLFKSLVRLIVGWAL